MYTYTQQYRNSTYMKFSLQATLKWAAQRMHSKVIRLVMHNTNNYSCTIAGSFCWPLQME